MFPPFLAIALGAKAPPQLTVVLFGVCSALGAGVTHYGTGPSPIYYNAAYVDLVTPQPSTYILPRGGLVFPWVEKERRV